MPTLKKITRADTVTIPSFVFPEDEARNRDFGATTPNSPKLEYDIEAIMRGESHPMTPEKKLKYDITALPGRPRFDITNEGKTVTPVTGAQAIGYYGVSKKSGADVSGLKAQMLPTIGEMAAAAEDLRLPRPVITAGSNGEHHKNSLHYKDLALDYRGNNIDDAKARAMRDLVDKRLGHGYDVLFEQQKGKPQNDHFHLEYDPPKVRR